MEMMKKLVAIIIITALFSACKDETKASTPEIIDDIENTVSIVDSVIEIIEEPIKKSANQIKDELMAKGFKTFDYVDKKTQDTVLMQQYFIVFLKTGPIRGQNEEETAELQEQHMAHLAKMYELGYADISGPFGDNGSIRGITIYNVPTLKMADSLANADPMVKAGRLEIEVHPWWAAKGFSLR